jgi:toxin secretion/phage lysis holin
VSVEHLKPDPASAIGAAVGAGLAIWLGMDVFIRALLVLMAADVATGLIAAAVNGTVSSAASRHGLARKAATLIVVMVTGWLSVHLGDYLGAGFPGGQAVAGACCLTELISMLENAKRAGMSLGPLDRVLQAARRVQCDGRSDPLLPPLPRSPRDA